VKIKTIKLSDKRRSGAAMYVVEQVTDSVEFRCGAILDKKAVEGLCISNEWKVTIVAKK